MLQTIVLPSKDYALLKEIVQKNQWKIQPIDAKKPTPKVIKKTNSFVVTDKMLAILDESAKTPLSECISEEDFLKYLDEV